MVDAANQPKYILHPFRPPFVTQEYLIPRFSTRASNEYSHVTGIISCWVNLATWDRDYSKFYYSKGEKTYGDTCQDLNCSICLFRSCL